MGNKKIYGFFGTPSYDMIIYLAAIITNLGKRVLVIDHSIEQDIMSCYIHPKEKINFFHYKNVDYTTKITLSSLDNLEYEYIFLYEDESSIETNIYDGIIVVSDFKKYNLKKVGELAKRFHGEVQFTIRDICHDKLNKQYILKKYLKLDTNTFDYNVIELDYYDFAYRIAMTHEYYQGFRHLSKSYKNCLLKIARWMEDPTDKILYQAYHLAERGRSIGSSFLE